ncbi:MAG: exo-alpha-sialidase, partial [Chitinophagaceae bacterium]|nr:exo-alpha-sialidase [Chitinophagaceae bacterium]
VWGVKNASPKNKYSGLINYAQSFDNGKTWSEAKKLVHDTAGYDQRYSDVTLLNNGEVGIMWLDNRKKTDKEGSAVYFAVTGGKDGFKNERLISESSCQCCRTSLYADSKGNIHALYRGIINDSIRDMIHIVSSDGGRTFTSPKKIHNDNWVLRGCPHTGPSMTENKQGLHFAWFTGARNAGCFYAGSNNCGDTYINRDNITTQGSHPQLATLENDKLVLAWDESFQINNGYTKRIGVELRSAEGKHELKNFITPDSVYASYPVIAGVKNNAAMLAYCVKKGDKNYIAYQQISFTLFN